MNNRKHNSGLTLIELAVVLAMVSIIVAIATPSITETIQKGRLSSAANSLAEDLNLARNESLKRGLRVMVKCQGSVSDCTANPSKWLGGWVVCVDNLTGSTTVGADNVCDPTTTTQVNPIRLTPPMMAGITVTNAAQQISFLPTGYSTGTASFTLKHNNITATRTVTVSPSGFVSSK